mmetsp:Transcript_5584/g.11384  ORF Transcript_5584/g.11384 Transcript_5584/m.11384 type:complete len:220 (+) Transcript_5584:460-1119(+)
MAALQRRRRIQEVVVAPNPLADVESVALPQDRPGEIYLAERAVDGVVFGLDIARQRSVEDAHTRRVQHKKHALDVGFLPASGRGAYHRHVFCEESRKGCHKVALPERTSHRSIHEDNVCIVALLRSLQANLVGAHVEALVPLVQVPNLRMGRDRYGWAIWCRVDNQHVNMPGRGRPNHVLQEEAQVGAGMERVEKRKDDKHSAMLLVGLCYRRRRVRQF